MNVHPRTRKDGSVVWMLEVHVKGRRATATVGPFPKAKDDGREKAEQAWYKLKQKVEERASKHITPSRESLQTYLEGWLERRKEDLKPTTWAAYESMIKNHVIPAIGKLKMDAVNPADVQTLLDNLRAKGLTRTVPLTRNILRKALKDALLLGLLEYNPVDRTQAPKTTKKRVECFTLDELDKLLKHAAPRWAPLFQFAAYSGLRRGELLGLRWEDIDLSQDLITIHRSIVAVKGKTTVQDDTKTEAGVRTFTIPSQAADALRIQKKMQAEDKLRLGPEYKDGGIVFATHVGTYLSPRNVTRAYEKARDSAGVSKLPFHALRHTSASIQLAARVPIEVVSKRLGHKNISMTVNVYSHLLPQADREAADAVSEWVKQHGGA